MSVDVLHVIIGLNRGGAEMMLKRLVLQSQDDVSHMVVSLTDVGVVGKELLDKGVNVLALGLTSRNFISTFFKLAGLIKRNKPQVLQTWMYHADLFGGVAGKLVGSRSVYWNIRTTDLSKNSNSRTMLFRKICALFSYAIPKKIICVADAAKKIHEEVGYCKKKMLVIENGFDVDLFYRPDLRASARSKFGFSDEDLVVGSVGRYALVKDQPNFLHALYHIKKEIPNAKGFLIGRGIGVDNSELMALISRLGLIDDVVLCGDVNNVPFVLSAMDVFCLHSKTEGFPNVLGEAMAAGLPCVSTNVGDASKLLGRIEAIVPAENAEALASTLISTMKMSAIDREHEGARARARVSALYSMNVIVDKYKLAYFDA
ncbi:hypothetical protein CBF45_09285 [Bordetella sp. J329]|nr:hypothetical protein CBF45_09285 [Bordetella sp. J329]